jgi:hypothetical protein
MSLVSIIAIISSPNVLTTVSSQGLRGSSIKTHRDHFSNEDLTINSPISLELLSFTEEAQLEERLEEDAESVLQEDLKADMIVEISDEEAQLEERLEEDAESVLQEDLKADMIVEISDEAIIENYDGAND